jgi:hypothetical protein
MAWHWGKKYNQQENTAKNHYPNLAKVATLALGRELQSC